MVSLLTVGLTCKWGKVSSQLLVFSFITLNFNIFNEAVNLLKVTKGIRKVTVLSLGMKMHAPFCQLCAMVFSV